MSTLRANTLKPITSGNSLVLQGDSGGSGVSGPSIDSNGDVDFSQNTNAKVKLPSGGGIYESNGSTEILTESGGTVSLKNTSINANNVFPSGHIVQAVYNPTLSNTSTGTVTSTSDVGRCDITGQITIASGNHVLIYLQCFLRTDGDTNSLGRASIYQGTSASLGTQLSQSTGGYDGGADFYIPTSMWAYDSNPQDATTPDYAVAISTGSGATTSVRINEFTSPRFLFFLFEVKA